MHLILKLFVSILFASEVIRGGNSSRSDCHRCEYRSSSYQGFTLLWVEVCRRIHLAAVHAHRYGKYTNPMKCYNAAYGMAYYPPTCRYFRSASIRRLGAPNSAGNTRYGSSPAAHTGT